VCLACIAAITGCAEPEWRVLGEGRYVELVTNRDEDDATVCGGTVAFYDRFVEAAFEFLGETPPDHVFVRYYWVPQPEMTHEGYAVRSGDMTSIVTDFVVSEHELAHAVHQQAWPPSNMFFYEGLATLLDPRREPVPDYDWPESATLDEILGRTNVTSGNDYYQAWYLVSQIIADHGVAGLRDFWRAVPRGSTPQEVRDAYQALFGRPMEVLTVPWEYDDGDDPGWWDTSRFTCEFALCTGEVRPWVDNVWTASGPAGCEDDPDAIGPMSYKPAYGLPVWLAP
jgi:hypothetical protein